METTIFSGYMLVLGECRFSDIFYVITSSMVADVYKLLDRCVWNTLRAFKEFLMFTTRFDKITHMFGSVHPRKLGEDALPVLFL